MFSLESGLFNNNLHLYQIFSWKYFFAKFYKNILKFSENICLLSGIQWSSVRYWQSSSMFWTGNRTNWDKSENTNRNTVWQCTIGKYFLFQLFFMCPISKLFASRHSVWNNTLIAGQRALREPCRHSGQSCHHAGTTLFSPSNCQNYLTLVLQIISISYFIRTRIKLWGSSVCSLLMIKLLASDPQQAAEKMEEEYLWRE